MENDNWICCNCGVVTLDRNGRCPYCHSDNLVPVHSPAPSPSSGIEQHWAEEAGDKVRVTST